jgi:hypothetical protein
MLFTKNLIKRKDAVKTNFKVEGKKISMNNCKLDYTV